MKIRKLNATDSTNSYLKELAKKLTLQNFTTVVTKNQTSGRGQVDNEWVSENGKNLLFSTFTIINDLKISQQKYLNFAVSLAVFNTLKNFKIPKLSIKWPNDIMSADKKICGILIENVLKNQTIYSSVIGIGLNVNQTIFSDDLPNATSLKKILKKELDLDILLDSVLKNLKETISLLNQQKYTILENNYLHVLYKKNIPTLFKNNNRDVLFMGIIKSISKDGKLQILLENETLQEFGIKEISFKTL